MVGFLLITQVRTETMSICAPSVPQCSLSTISENGASSVPQCSLSIFSENGSEAFDPMPAVSKMERLNNSFSSLVADHCELNDAGEELWFSFEREEKNLLSKFVCEEMRRFLALLSQFMTQGIWDFREDDVIYKISNVLAEYMGLAPVENHWSLSRCETKWVRFTGRLEIDTCTVDKPLSDIAPRWWYQVHGCWYINRNYDIPRDCERLLYNYTETSG